MRYKSLLMLLAGVIFTSMSFAQSMTVKGKVTSADDNSPLPGVTIVIENTSKGTVTDLDGNYQIEVEGTGVNLVFSFVGMETKTVTVTGPQLNVALSAGVELDEVMVTALGVSREKKSLGYAVQGVDGDDLSEAKEVNVVNSLSGKVAGVQVASATGSMGGSSRILIRGASSIDNSNNQPLFVIDGVPVDNSNFTSANQERGAGGYDYGNAIQDINPDDIAEMSVLKGAAATALYGSRGANGVILITTKKGKSGKGGGIGVEYRFGYSIDNAYILPDYQNQYGGGFTFDTLWYSENPEGFSGNRGEYEGSGSRAGDTYDLLPEYAVDESWGPELDGSKNVRHWWSFDENDPSTFGKTAPWEANPDNIRDFFETGATMTNTIALSNANENGSWRLGYTNTNQTGVFPNSKLKRNNLSLNTTNKFSKKLEARIGINYAATSATGRPGTGYDGNNVMQQFNQWGQRQWSQERMEDHYMSVDGDHQTWNRISWDNPTPKYTDNPYWTRNANYQNDSRERVFGNVGLGYIINDKQRIDLTAMSDFYTDDREERIAIGSQAIPMYSIYNRFVMENNYELKWTINTRINENIGLMALAGGNIRENMYRRLGMETQDGLNAPDFYNISNSVSPALVDQYFEKKRMNSVFGSASFDFNRMFYVDLSGRIDASSALPTDNRTFAYGAVTASWIFTELESLKNNDILSFGKLRAGYASVGNDTDPYNTDPLYIVDPGFNGNANVSLPNTRNNPNLLPERTKSFEVGLEMAFWLDRLSVDLTYYTASTYDQIIRLPVSATTGYRYQVVNAGQMDNSGIELAINGGIIRGKDFKWDMGVNFARNRSEVVELYDDGTNVVDNYLLQIAPFAVSVNAVAGEPYGSIYGYGIERVNGEPVVDENGFYVRTDEQQVIGNVLPDWVGGVTNRFSYKNWSMSALIDVSMGGDVFSTTNMWAKYSGMTEETAGNNDLGNPLRDPVLDADGNPAIAVPADEAHSTSGGTYIEGVDENGNPVAYYTTTNYSVFYNGGYVVGETDVYDASYVYLREMTLNYRFPSSVADKVGLSSLSMGLYGRNLWLMHSNVPHLDPTALINSASNVQGLEGAALPSVRTFGFNLMLTL